MPTHEQEIRDLERKVSAARAELDYAVIQLTLKRFPGGIVDPYEGPIAGRACLQWEGPGRSLKTVITDGSTMWITADLPEADTDALVNAALGVDARRYQSPVTLAGHTGSIAEAYPGYTHFMDHEDGTPAGHHVVRIGDGTAHISLGRIPLDKALYALATLHKFLSVTRVPATR
ncbi:hypothetical protein ACFQ0M_48290 [Kitasatospora aburaviensis]|uniref:Uncharacterized protein n=1 Tax=Kitasatospora aburaviensis TaxID=67265 RepID=A0ABW1F0H2_9ACTN